MTTSRQILIEKTVPGSRVGAIMSYVFEVVGDLDQPGALKIISINNRRHVSLQMVPDTIYRQAIEKAKAS